MGGEELSMAAALALLEKARKKVVAAGLNPIQEKMYDPSLCILPDSTIESFADHLLSENLKNIIVLTGAGISTSAGIPDFRSPGSGLYSNLQQYDLPYPEAIFDINYFHERPDPFFVLAKEMQPGNFNPTYAHYFIALLEKKGLLLRNYTQNIDTLERVAGVSEDKLVEAHGSFATASCVGSRKGSQRTPGCGAEYSSDWMKDNMKGPPNNIPRCPSCDGLVKPDIVFFGESLPSRFHTLIQTDFQKCDAVIVMGTSLTVFPFAALVDMCDETVPRLLVNRDLPDADSRKSGRKVFDFTGESHKYRRDALYLGSIEDGVLRIAELMGMKDELIELRESELNRLMAERKVFEDNQKDEKTITEDSTEGVNLSTADVDDKEAESSSYTSIENVKKSENTQTEPSEKSTPVSSQILEDVKFIRPDEELANLMEKVII